ncbi:MAG: alpha/beta fold hydrolase [Planctomycetaceae bacterium]|nr:alpha/beta fold hydrolase [Planctomycetaceae bacterium]MBT4846563.1 alpha/beta fold hydrolase [Planctomycetaceae bacterium]MBT5125947.1 alpha/beta fold hydrolase [Planctomycetaceae bacterium]MBT5600545.1 alpha/beta fold hydrolase [Planctomycetaceae bacterium]MBT5882904.1 alpha/beta fold hydrolase [Planctomycetaceae bacterium]
MRNMITSLLMIVLFCLPLHAVETEINLSGKWHGTLAVGGAKLRIGLEIVHTGNSLNGNMYSFDQGSAPIALEKVTYDGEHFSFQITALKASYTAEVKDSGNEMKGLFVQGIPIALILKRVDEFPRPNRPQEPQAPFPYDIIEVEYINKESGGTLAGTLTLPPGRERVPVALLITGSGSQDRDETILGHRPFWVIADHLTRAGIGVLRVDDRGVGGSSKVSSGDTTLELVTDVEAGVEFLRGHPRVDKRAVWLIGHSEGGMIAPMVAVNDRRLTGIVCLAGPGVSGADILVEQNRLLRGAAGVDKKTLDWFMPLFKETIDLVLANPKDAADATFIENRKTLVAKHMKSAPVLIKLAAAQINTEIEAIGKQLSSPWMRYFLSLDPVPAIQNTRCPVFAVFGENDLQVPPKQSAGPFETALQFGKCRDYQVKIYPQLNHLLQHSKTGAVGEYGTIEETISPEVLNDVTEFIRGRL